MVLQADDGVTVADTVPELVRAARASGDNVVSIGVSTSSTTNGPSGATRGAPTLYHLGERLDPTKALADSGLREGSLIAVADPAASLLEEPPGLVELRLVSGPGAGEVHRLTVGEATVGSDPGCVVRLTDPSVPPVAATVSVKADGTTTVTPYDASGVTLDREALGEATDWPVGGLVTIGRTMLELERVTEPDAAVEPSAEAGWIDYNRPPRLLPPLRRTKFKLPAPPSEQTKTGLPWLVMLMPLGLAVALALILHKPYFLMMGLMSPMMMLGSYLQGRRQGKVTYRQQLAEYKEKKKRIEADAAQAVVDERIARRAEAPDPATALLIAAGPRMRLWERRVTDPDYLTLRIGVGDLPSEVSVDDPEELEHRRETTPTAYDVPVTVDLGERGVVGVAGRDELPRRIASWMVAQLGVLQSPRDTWVYVLTDADHATDWDWLRWLPHARPQHGQDTMTTLGVDTESCARRIAELTAILTSRRQALANRSNAVLNEPDVVVVLDGARRLRNLPGVVALLKEGPALGIRSICLDVDERLLPEEATAVVVQTHDGVTLRQMRGSDVEHVTPDLVGLPWLQRVSRALAPLRDVSGGDDDSVLPSACRLTEVLGIEPPTADALRARWAMGGRSTSAVIGASLDGAFALDLVRDGPHGLIAGTTGAGKSELLQSLVASLAVANRPDAMTFVLVDYKGGAAFKDCVDLPHTVGMVTDLDTHLVERALVSLGAELTRREHQLAEGGAKDIEDYIDIRAKRSHLAEMPRLLIVIDEFASLARELPDFVTGLVNIAQRGRSLGIHLILATQRPGGVVSPEIRANTNLRIALRVTDSTESSDVIDAPDAAGISKATPGRAYARLGASSLVPFQAGRVGGRRPGTVAVTHAKPWVTLVGLRDLADPPSYPPRAESSDDAEITDLKVLVEAIRAANDALGLEPQHSPWLPALTTEVLLDELLADVVTEPGRIPAAPFAVEDLPAQQARRSAVIDLHTFSHLAIVGGPRSGRSQALRTMAGSLARLTSPEDVHLYGIDCGNGALLPLDDLPHTGAVVQRTQTDRAVRLLQRLIGELSRRQEILGMGGYADLTEQRASGDDPLPHIMVMLDRWEGFLGSLSELDGGTPFEQVQTLLREGASTGIHLVITGDRQLVNARMGSLIEDKIGLRLPDRGDYTLMGLSPRKLPEDVPEGRGFRSESAIELQFALLTEDPGGQAQGAALRAIGAAAKERAGTITHRPFRVDVLPSRIGFEAAWDLRVPEVDRPLWAMVGVGGDDLTARGLDLARTPQAIIAGPPRSGRSTVLVSVVESLLRGGAEVVIAAPRPSPLREYDGRAGVRAVLTGVEITEQELAPLVDEGEGPVVLVVDDGELLKDVEAKDYLRALQRTAVDRGRAIVLGGDVNEVAGGFSGWQVDMKGRQGLLINPQSITDGELLGVRVPRSSLGNNPTTGRAFLNDGSGDLQLVQVPAQ
ncbi:FtsK/SpoIIIE domain-containing protein [Nocardioides marmoribigeumensis]